MASRERRLSNLLQHIDENGPVKYSDLKIVVEKSDPTLSGYLKTLEERGDIEHFEKKDRREKWYRVKQERKQQVKAKLLKHESTKFIEGIQNPLYAEKEGEIEGSTVGMSFFLELELPSEFDSLKDELRTMVMARLEKIMEKRFKEVGKELSLDAKEVLEKVGGPSHYKFAVVQTVCRDKD